MTNAIIMSAMLSTNWGFTAFHSDSPGSTNAIFFGRSVQHGEVWRSTVFYTMDGTNKVLCGYSLPVKAGTIYRTNGVLGPIIWDKP